MFRLFDLLATIPVLILIGVVGSLNISALNYLLGIVFVIYALVTTIASITVAVRRLHDTGKSGWYWLILLIPIVGGIWFLVILCTDSQSGENKYGPNPKKR